MAFLARLKNLIRVGKITGAANNSTQFPVQQLTFKGKVTEALMIFPYGVYANVSIEDALALFFSIDGNEENKAAIAYTPQKRPTDLANGEVAVYHPTSNSFIKFRNNGNIEVEGTGQINIVTTGDVNLECNAASVTAAASVDIDSPVTNLGSGGQPIARVGDAVQVNTTTGVGTITAGGTNTSI